MWYATLSLSSVLLRLAPAPVVVGRCSGSLVSERRGTTYRYTQSGSSDSRLYSVGRLQRNRLRCKQLCTRLLNRGEMMVSGRGRRLAVVSVDALVDMLGSINSFLQQVRGRRVELGVWSVHCGF